MKSGAGRPAAVAVTADARALATIHGASFDDSWSELFFGALLNQPGVTALGASVGPEDATLAGFIVVRQAADEGEVLTLAVAPEARRRGLGAALLEGALVVLGANRAGRCFLEVAADNIAARALYEAAGFKPVATRRDYYARPQSRVDALVMELRLPPVG